MNQETSARRDLIVALPKVLLHDHLDGGLRPQTIIDLADAVGHRLPTNDPEELAAWFSANPAKQGSDGPESEDPEVGIFGSLEQYLETFAHTTAVMQTAEALTRVAREAVLDLAADGVVYTEQRWAPEQHLAGGLSLDDAVAAVQRGLREGMELAAAQGRPIQAYQLLCAMRQNDHWDQIADLAIRWLHRDADAPPDAVAERIAPGSVVGFDLAGPEAGFPPDGPQSDIWLRLAEASVPVTIHAGEGDGLASIDSAVHVGRALRLGHGVRIVDDVHAVLARSDPDCHGGGWELGPLADWVRDRRIPLEVAVRSNVQTRAAGATSVANHPVTDLLATGFAVTLNTDNRLMSRTSMTTEMLGLVRDAGWTLGDLYDVTVNAAKHAFIHYPDRQRLIENVINPAFSAAREKWEDE